MCCLNWGGNNEPPKSHLLINGDSCERIKVHGPLISILTGISRYTKAPLLQGVGTLRCILFKNAVRPQEKYDIFVNMEMSRRS